MCPRFFLDRLAEVPAIAKFTARIRHFPLRTGNHSGFFFGREIVCLNFLKTDLYLTLTQRKWNASSLRRKIRFLSAFFIFLPDSYDPTVKLKVKI